MSGEKQIEKNQIDKMVRDIFSNTLFSLKICKIIAKALYKANYRKQKWISVEERLPQKHDEVLVFCDGARQLDFICSSGRWYDHDHKKVTHWMPLPEAPKMKGGAEE